MSDYDDPFRKLAHAVAPMQKLMAENNALIRLTQQVAPMKKLMAEQDAFLRLAQAVAPMQKLMAENDSLVRITRQIAPMHKLMAENDAFIRLTQQVAPMQKLMVEQETFFNLAQAVAPLQKIMAENNAFIRLAHHVAPLQKWRTIERELASSLQQAAKLMTASGPAEFVTFGSAINTDALDRGLGRIHQELQRGARRQPEIDDVFGDVFVILARMIADAKEALEIRALLKLLAWLLPLLVMWWLANSSDRLARENTDSIRQELRHNEDQDLAVKNDLADQAHKDATETNRRLDQLLNILSDRTTRTDSEFYVVMRAVPLCSGPKYSGPRIAVLVPQVEVEVLEHARKWLRVKVLAKHGEILEGWVLKKYLQKID